MANDVDPNGLIDPASVSIVDAPQFASDLTIDPLNGAITYVHDGTTLPDTLTYTVADDAGNVSNVATVFLSDGLAPPLTDGLVLALQSDVGVLATASQVTEWTDTSGQGNHLTSAGDPQLIPNATPTGQPALVLDGDVDKLERLEPEGLSGLPADNADRTVLTVLRYVDPQGVTAGVVYGKANQNRTFGLVADPASGNLAVQGFNSPADLVSSEPAVAAGWLLQGAVHRDSNLVHYSNGLSLGGWTHVYQTRVDAPSSKIVIGEDISGQGASQLEVAAVLVYDRAVTDAERVLLESFLTQKYLVSNAAPVAVDDVASVAIGGNVVVDLLANDLDDGLLDPSSVDDRPAAQFCDVVFDQSHHGGTHVPARRDRFAGWAHLYGAGYGGSHLK